VSGHTPGPWKARQIGANAWRIETVPDGDYVPLSVAVVVTTVLEVGVSYSDAADNARLIAAAPELKEALEDCLGLLKSALRKETREQVESQIGDVRALLVKINDDQTKKENIQRTAWEIDESES
jgi:hypothetical protein